MGEFVDVDVGDIDVVTDWDFGFMRICFADEGGGGGHFDLPVQELQVF